MTTSLTLSRREVLLGTLLAVAAGPVHAEAPARSALVDEVSGLVAKHFFDRAAVEQLWPEILARHAARTGSDAAPEQVAAELDAMLAELKVSHTGYYRPPQLAYYELFDVLRPTDSEERLKELFPEGEVAYDGIGVVPRAIDGRVFLAGVYHGGPGDRAGLLTGDEVVSVEGGPFDPVASFIGRRGQAVTLQVRRTEGGPVIPVAVTPERIRPNTMFLDAMRASMRLVERGGRKLGYVRVWCYAGRHYQGLLTEELAQGRLKDGDGLVLDLRGGWGGAQPDYTELFVGGGPIMTVTNQAGERDFASFRWRRPVVVLIDQGSRSGKEVVAFGLQRRGVRLVGTRTAGALLAAQGFLLSNGALLELAVLDVAVEGERLEGRGVAPDVEVPFHLPYAAGADPQLEAALAELERGLTGNAG